MNNYLIPFYNIFPLGSIIFHYTILLIWFGVEDHQHINKCDQNEIETFMAYWVPHVTVVFIISLCINVQIKWIKCLTRCLYTCWTSLLSTIIFISWSVVREEPFACFRSGEYLYIYAPIVFLLIHLITCLTTYLFVKKRIDPELQPFVRLSDQKV